MRELFIAFVQKCLGIHSHSALYITGGKVKYTYDLMKMKRSEKRKENKKMKQLLERVITANGINKQLDVAIEELSELLQAICKIKRREPDECLNEDYLINLAEEMADVEIILAELKLLFDNEDNVKEWKNYKLDRLEKRLKEKSGFEIMSGVYDLSE